MTQNQRLRALLAEARETLLTQHDPQDNIAVADRIDAALAEPSEAEETEHAMHMRIRAGYDKTIADSWRAKVAEVERERDEARAEVEHWKAAAKQHAENHTAAVEEYFRAERERDEARAEANRYRKTLDCIADGTVWNSKESAEFVLGRKP